MKLKEGIKVNGIKTELLLGLIIADKIYGNYSHDLVVTEITGGKHGIGSLHYSGNAADLRTYYFTNTEVQLVAKDLKDALGENYDVVVEKTHIHIEFQPK